ncbi:PEGA domain-containing protein [Haliangium sp.]|uniref:PEGA domain-containing protein n=1 Tax=Haliangium sp. TaxID=2663208 RepID=UPI003D09ADC1
MTATRWGTLLAFTALFAVAGSARAQGGAAPMPERFHVVLYPSSELSEPARLDLEAALAEGVREAGARHVERSLQTTVADDAATEALTRNDQAAAEARRRMGELELAGALDVLDWAADEYSTYLPDLVRRDGNPARLAEIFTLEAITQYLNGDEDAAAAAFRRALVLDPDIRFDPDTFPPPLEPFVDQQRAIARAAGRGRVRVEATAGALVFVNGVERGVAPLTVRGLPVGTNLVHVRMPGAKPAMREVQIRGRPVEVAIELEALPSELTGPLVGTRADVGPRRASQALHDAAEAVNAAALVLVLTGRRNGRVTLTAYVYDMRSGDLAGRGEVRLDASLERGPAESARDQARVLSRDLVESGRWRTLVDLEVASSPPLWKRPLFWGAVGVAAGAVVVGVVIASNQGLSNAQRVVLLPAIGF